MTKIDCYTHAMPSTYRDALLRVGIQDHYFVPQYLMNIEERSQFLSQFPGVKNVITPMQLPLNHDLPGETFEDLARIYNDGMAEIASNTPEIVAAVAAVPLNNVDSAMKETERAITKLGMKGILLPCNYRGLEPSSPEYRPLLEMMAGYNLPIWLHPWPAASSRPYIPNSGGWEMIADTADAMLHLACSGIFDDYPNIKIIAHHGGSYIPFFHTRLKSQYFWDLGLKGNMYDPNRKEHDHTKAYHYYDCLKKFYVDTAFYGICTPQIQACISYFGADHVMFGTDFPLPFSNELEPCIESINMLDIGEDDRELIYSGNISRLLML